MSHVVDLEPCQLTVEATGAFDAERKRPATTPVQLTSRYGRKKSNAISIVQFDVLWDDSAVQ